MKLNFQKILLNFSQMAWLLPFLAFGVGYIFLQFFITEHSVQTPNLVGKDILQATKISSDYKLNLRIIGEKEIADAQPGTIIKQNPLPNTSIKSHQSIFIVITKLPAPIIAPSFIGKYHADIEKICKEKGIKNRYYLLPATHPTGQCFAQIPQPEQILETKKMSCYISTGNHTQYLFPDFTGIALGDVIQFMQQQNMQFDVFYKDQKITTPYKQNMTITYQKPLAGTLITLNNKLYVQLQVT